MAVASSPALFKLSGTDDFCCVAENCITNCTTNEWLCPSAPQKPKTKASLRKDDRPFFQEQPPSSIRERKLHREWLC